MNTNPASGRTLQFILVILCLLSLAMSAFLGQAWLAARHENAALRTSLELATRQSQIIQQQLESERLVSRRQTEMLREKEAQEGQRKP